MFVRASTLILAIAAGAIAAPGNPTSIARSGECNTGNIQCCNTPQSMSSLSAGTVEGLGLLGLAIPINGLVAGGCSPITVVGEGSGAECTQQTVCCDNVDQNGLVNIACVPISLNV